MDSQALLLPLFGAVLSALILAGIAFGALGQKRKTTAGARGAARLEDAP